MISQKELIVGIYKEAFPGSALGTDYDPIGEYSTINGGTFIFMRENPERNFAMNYEFKDDNFYFRFGQDNTKYFISMLDPDLVSKFKEMAAYYEINRDYLRGFK